MQLTMKQARKMHRQLFRKRVEKGKPREKRDNYISFREWAREAVKAFSYSAYSPKLQEILK